jgi:histidinol dehydrogenase
MISSDTAGIRLRVTGRLSELSEADRRALVEREPVDDELVAASVRDLIQEVRDDGDIALRSMAKRFDGVSLETLEVPRGRWESALDTIDTDVRRALERAAANIGRFHEAQLPEDVVVDVEPGVRITRSWAPLERVGIYAPGGTAAYPSSVLMGVVPAKAAGVPDVVVCSPPGPTGTPPDAVMAACAIAGADRLFALGGAGAVGALAFGTESVPEVDAIVGPGNRWVTEAKRQVAGRVVIDAPAGPSEVLVLADESADAVLVALEMLAQAEHDPDAVCVTVTTSEGVAAQVVRALAERVGTIPRADVIGRSFETTGAVLVADTMDEAVSFVEGFAPEHLSLMTSEAAALSRRIRNSGTTFVGSSASVAFGDYLTGANHVLPTAGRARSFSGLSTQHFLRSFTIQEIDREGAASMAPDVVALANAEGLPAHAAAAAARMGGGVS